MEPAVLRVKRKRGAEPVEALIISCKRPRVEEEKSLVSSDTVTTRVFKLAATVTSQNEPLQKYVQEAMCRDRSSQVPRPRIGSLQHIQKDLRALKDAERQESRYRLVSSLRVTGQSDDSQPASPAEEQEPAPEASEASGKDENAAAKGEKDETFHVFDLVQEETEKEPVGLKKASDPETIVCNSVRMIREQLAVSEEGQGSEHRENPEEFVYDIYYAESSSQNWIQDILSVQPYYYEQELVAADDGEPDEVYEDEDDENEESNWRNDYPDEEDEECSDREERYTGYYEDSDDSTERGRGHTSDGYRHKSLRECEYDEEEDSD